MKRRLTKLTAAGLAVLAPHRLHRRGTGGGFRGAAGSEEC